MSEYALAQEAKVIGDDLIPKFHDHLRHVRIEYVFNDSVIKSKGKEMLGRAKKKSGLDAFLAASTSSDPEPFFVIEISKPAWDLLDQKQKKALVDHELCHCLWDVDKGIFMRTHDVEEFSEIIKRHGLWQPDVELFATIAAKHVKQINLPMDEPDVKVRRAAAGATIDGPVSGNGKPDLEPITETVSKKTRKSRIDQFRQH